MHMSLKVFYQEPVGFTSKLSVVGCYCQYQASFLLLKRHPRCLSGDKWCLPGGKLERGESNLDGAIRELHEESGIVAAPDELSNIGTLFLGNSNVQFDFTIYFLRLEKRPSITLQKDEHVDSVWTTHDEAISFPLIDGGSEVLDYCLQKRGQFSI